jgi:hypothetical protein
MATNTPPPDNSGVKVYDQPKRGLSPALIIPILLALGVLAYFLMRPRQAEPVNSGNSGAMRTMERSNPGGESGTTGGGTAGNGGMGAGTGGNVGGSTAGGGTTSPPGPPAAAGGR